MSNTFLKVPFQNKHHSKMFLMTKPSLKNLWSWLKKMLPKTLRFGKFEHIRTQNFAPLVLCLSQAHIKKQTKKTFKRTMETLRKP